MKLYVMRHGPAEDHAESGIDGDRPLSAAGRERTRAVAEALCRASEEPLAIVTSPLVRAVQTAEIVALVTRLGDRGGTVDVSRAMAPSGDPLAFARLLAARGRRRIMVVGHEPDLSGLVHGLLGEFSRPFEKAMVVGLQLAAGPGPAKLRFVLEPKGARFDPDARTST